MQEKTVTMYIVWNSGRTECVAFTNHADAYWTAHGEWPSGYEGTGVPSIGERFRELYAGDLGEGEVFEVRHQTLTRPALECDQAESHPVDGQAMHRFRFQVASDDYRPMAFPPVGPYWCTGYNDTHAFVVAYAPDEETLTNADHWPDAEDVQDLGEQEITFTDRFRKPDWWVASTEST